MSRKHFCHVAILSSFLWFVGGGIYAAQAVSAGV